MDSLDFRNRDELLLAAQFAIIRGDSVLDRAHDGDSTWKAGHGSLARAHYARASTLIQLAGYLGMTEEQARQEVRWTDLATAAALDAPPMPRGSCDLPPAGWYCPLAKGHGGPCPTWRDPSALASGDEEYLERVRQEDRIAGIDQANARERASR